MHSLQDGAARIIRGGWNKKRGRKRRGGREEEIGRDQKIAQHTVHEAERRKIQQEETDLFRGDRRIQVTDGRQELFWYCVGTGTKDA